MPTRKTKGRFIQPMLLLRTDARPNDREHWQYELKVDGYRAIAFKAGGKLRSRNNNDFTKRYPGVLKGLAKLPNETVIDGEVVAFDADGRPSFNALQNFASAETAIVSYVFDLLVLAGRDVRGETLEPRRELLERRVVRSSRSPSSTWSWKRVSAISSRP